MPQDDSPTADKSEPEPKNKRIRNLPRRRLITIVVVTLVILIAGLAVGVPYYLYSRTHESTDDAFIAGHIVRVAGRVPGRVIAVNVTDNQRVKQGDVLAELDPSDYQSHLAAAQAALTSADATLSGAVAGVTRAAAAIASAESHLASARSSVQKTLDQVNVAKAVAAQAEADANSAQAEAHRDETDLKRAQELKESGSYTPQQLDHAIATADVSNAKWLAAKQAVESARTRVAAAESDVNVARAAEGEAESQIKEARATYTQAQAQSESARAARDQAAAAVQLAQLNLSYTRIIAPANGRVTGKTVEAGNYIQPGQTLLALVPEDVWVVANFKETQIADIRPGQHVDISVDAYDKVFSGRIDSIQMGTGAVFSLLPPENATGNYIKVVQRVPVKIVFDQPIDFDKYHIAPGMSVVPTVDTASQPSALAASPIVSPTSPGTTSPPGATAPSASSPGATSRPGAAATQ